jgi:hypothetical protein
MQSDKRVDAVLGVAVIFSPIVGIVVFCLALAFGLNFILWADLVQLYMFVPSIPNPAAGTVLGGLTFLSIMFGLLAMVASFRWISRLGKATQRP